MSPLLLAACATSKGPAPPEPLWFEPQPQIPARVQVSLPLQSSLATLTALAAPFGTRSVKVADPKALEQQALVIRADQAVAPEVVWLAWRVALDLSGWSVREGEVDELIFGGPAPAYGAPVVVIAPVEGISAAALHAWVDPHLPADARLEVDPASNSAVYGGSPASVDALEMSIDEAITWRLTPDGRGLTLCAGAPGPVPAPSASASAAAGGVRLNFPNDSSLLAMSKFLCDLHRVEIVIPEYRALEQATFTLHSSAEVSPATTWRIYQLALGLRGWALQPSGASAQLVRAAPVVPEGELVSIDVFTAEGAPAVAERLGQLGVRAVADGSIVIAGGSEAALRAALSAPR